MATKDLFAHRKPKLVTKPFVAVDKPKRGRPAKSEAKRGQFPSTYKAEPLKMDLSSVTLGPKPEPAKLDIASVLDQRGSRYGSFVGHAKVTQDFKRLLKKHLDDRNKVLTDDQQEALEMIFHKIGRIVNGDADYDDSWVDVAGYSKLVADRLQGTVR